MSRIKILQQRGPSRAVGAGQPLSGFKRLGSVDDLANGRSGTLWEQNFYQQDLQDFL